MWYQSATPYDAQKLDVIYLVSTDVLSATDENGNEVWQSQLSVRDKAAIDEELNYVEGNLFFSDYNMIAPYYHQFTFNALCQLDQQRIDSVYQRVVTEVCDAFDYYMEHKNNGRNYVLAGFSQGAMLTLDLLKHMTDEQYSRMVACYTIGYRVTAEDLQHPHIKAAEGELDHGVVISFNSSQTREAIWPLVSEGAATCINPVNWKVDATPATFTYDGTNNTVHVDTLTHTLLVDTDNPSYFYQYFKMATFYGDAKVNRDNLHHWDLLFYTRQIHDNALNREKAFKSSCSNGKESNTVRTQ